MRQRLWVLVFGFVCLLASPASAQWGYIGYTQVTVDNTAGGVPFPSSHIGDSGHMRPTQAFCFLESGDIRWTIDGTAPTTSVGNLAVAESALPAISGTTLLSNFRAIRTGGTSGTLSCSFFAGGSLPFREWGVGSVASAGGGGGGAVTQSGTWTVQPGNTANSTAWLVTGTGGTFPASQSGTWTIQPGNTANTTAWLFAGGLADNGVAAGTNRLGTLPGIIETTTTTKTNGRNAGFSFTTSGVARMVLTGESGTAQSFAADSCQDAASVETVVIAASSSGNNQLVAISGSETVTVCGYQFTVDAAVDVQFIYGTGSACATGETNLTGVMKFTDAGDGMVNPPGSKYFATIAAQALCVELSGAVGINGVLQYVQQ
jgi:hypothetical protein